MEWRVITIGGVKGVEDNLKMAKKKIKNLLYLPPNLF